MGQKIIDDSLAGRQPGTGVPWADWRAARPKRADPAPAETPAGDGAGNRVAPPLNGTGAQEVPDGAAALAAAEGLITKYVVLPTEARLVIALCAAATWLFELFDAFPYLRLSSPAPRCGKTRLLEILELLVSRPWRGTAPTEAALFRYIEANTPTLLLDEVEGLARRNASDRDSAVLAVLNAGYKRGQTVPRCVGNSHRLQTFRVYCPKAFAAIGPLPGTLADRSIAIPMQRRAPGESVARFRFSRAKQAADPVRSAVERSLKALAPEIEKTYAELPELSFLSDRDEEILAL